MLSHARRLGLFVVLALLGCQQMDAPGEMGGDPFQARRKLESALLYGPVPMIVTGNPFADEAAELDKIVRSSFADGVRALSPTFAPPPPGDRLTVYVHLSGNSYDTTGLCSDAAISTSLPSSPLRVLAVACENGEPIAASRTITDIAPTSPADYRFQRQIWRVANGLFPDPYAASYGFNILPFPVYFGASAGF